MPTRKTKATRKLAPDPRLNSRLKRHIKSLGHVSVDGYLAWCKHNRFPATLSKNLAQLQQEIAYRRKRLQDSGREKFLNSHLHDLGLGNVVEYQKWCRSHGFSDARHKSSAQRRQEKDAKKDLSFSSDLRSDKQRMRHLDRTIKAIGRGEINVDVLTHPGLKKVHRIVENIDCVDTRKAFVRILAATLSRARFLDVSPVIAQFGSVPGNTYIEALGAVARYSRLWLRSPESWEPKQHNLLRSFGSLTRHLLTLYDIPTFMNSVWFVGESSAAKQQQGWFLHIGEGKNIRKADLPLRFTKAMAHLFLQAPDHYTVTEALRWCQVRCLGGSQVLADHILVTRLGTVIEDDAFWETVIHFFINNPMLDFDYFEPIVSYISHLRYLSGQEVGRRGPTRTTGPPQPDFSMKGREPRRLLEQVDEWRRESAKENRPSQRSWDPSGIPAFQHLEECLQDRCMYRWTIDELLSRKEVVDESKAMKHCVRSYVPACAKGKKSVWSMQAENIGTGVKRRVLTIAVKNSTRSVVEYRGKCNVLPGVRSQSRRAAEQLRKDEERLKEGKKLLQRWAREAGLAV